MVMVSLRSVFLGVIRVLRSGTDSSNSTEGGALGGEDSLPVDSLLSFIAGITCLEPNWYRGYLPLACITTVRGFSPEGR